jgi:hypothetical protein
MELEARQAKAVNLKRWIIKYFFSSKSIALRHCVVPGNAEEPQMTQLFFNCLWVNLSWF